MDLEPFIIINERIKAHLFNAKEKREISYRYLRSLPSNL
jgi:hypothetical protein